MLLELALGAGVREAILAVWRRWAWVRDNGRGSWPLRCCPPSSRRAWPPWAAPWGFPVLAPDLDLSVFTRSSASVKLAVDVASFTVPLAALAVLTAVALGIEMAKGLRSGAAWPSTSCRKLWNCLMER